MNLQCPFCQYVEIFEEALFCRDCGFAYISVAAPDIIYNGENTTSFIASNNHLQKLEIGPVKMEENIFGDIKLFPTEVPMGQAVTIQAQFQKVPKFLKQLSSMRSFPFHIRISSMNNIIERKFQLNFVFSPSPKVNIGEQRVNETSSDSYPVFRFCPTSPFNIRIPIDVKKGPLIIDKVEIEGLEVKKYSPPRKIEPDSIDEALTILPENHSRLIKKIERHEVGIYKVALSCSSLKEPLTFPIEIRHTDKPILSFKIERWTRQGYVEQFKIDPQQGFSFSVGVGETYRCPVLAGAWSEDSGNTGSLKIYNISCNSPEIRVRYPDKAIRPPFEIPLTKELELEISGVQSDFSSYIELDTYTRLTENNRTQIKIPINVQAVQKEEYPEYVGLDFGTSNSCVAICYPELDGNQWLTSPLPPLVENMALDTNASSPAGDAMDNRDAQILPSHLDIEAPPKSIHRIGHPAVHSNGNDLNNKSLFKRFVADEEQAGRESSVLFLEELIFRIEAALASLGIPLCIPARICMAVPTGYSFEKQILRECCQEAMIRCGIENPHVSLIDESMAAMTYFLTQMDPSDKIHETADFIMVIDFGGGTTDIAIAEKRNDIYHPIISGGDPKLGGKEITDWVGKYLKVTLGQAESIKCSLIDENRWERVAKSNKLKATIQQVRAHIMDRLKPKLKLILHEAIFDLINDAYNIGENEQNQKLVIMLAGGSSALLGYDLLVSEIIGELKRDLDPNNQIELEGVFPITEPKRCVSRGAFIYQNLRSINLDMSRPISPHRVLWPLPLGAHPPQLRSTTVTVQANDSWGTNSNFSTEERFAVIIDRNTPVPTPPPDRRVISLKEDLGISGGFHPFKLFTQVGSATPLSYRFHPSDNVPEEIETDRRFSVYLDENSKIKVDLID